MKRLSIIVFIMLLMPAKLQALVAFPTAEGHGENATGGRGGAVYIVNVLTDNVASPPAGSLRECMEASGARTCVFATGGTIDLDDRIIVSNGNLTIAGQTAPGGGITVKGMIDLRASDIIIRHIRVRPNFDATPNPDVTDGIQITSNASNIIMDHVSISWASDENFSIFGGGAVQDNITLQWSIISEGLNCDSHSEGCHSKGILVGFVGVGDVSLHHNLLAHNVDRNPNITGGNVDIRNNVIYNFNFTNIRPQYKAVTANIVGNRYVQGLGSTTQKPVRLCDGDIFNSTSGVYLESNIDTYNRTSDAQPETDIARHACTTANPLAVVGSPYTTPTMTTTTAAQALTDVLARAGSLIPLRDSVDTGMVADVNAGTGTYVDSVTQAGGYPTLAAGTPYTDADGDGIDDAWETLYGLNPALATDGPTIATNGYSNLENYLNYLAGDNIIPTSCEIGAVDNTTLVVNWQNSLYPPLSAVDNTKFAVTYDGVPATENSTVIAGTNQTRTTMSAAPAGSGVVVAVTVSAGAVSTTSGPDNTAQDAFTCTNNLAGVTATLTQTAAQWRYSNGTEASPDHVFPTVATNIAAGGCFGLRTEVTCTVAACPTQGYRVQVSTGGAYADVPGTCAGAFCMGDAPDVNQGQATTDQLGTPSSFKAGAVIESQVAIPSVALGVGDDTELLYIICSDTAAGGITGSFRVYEDGGGVLGAYTVTPTLTVGSGKGGGF